MSERLAFLQHIAENPDADLPRLVFADWLDEQGDSLGEFIRVQIELHQRQDRIDDDTTQQLLAREAELLPPCQHEWPDYWETIYERGLPHIVRMDWRDFADVCHAVLDRCPAIRAFSVRAANLVHQPVLEAPLAQVLALYLEGWPESAFLDELLRSPNWNPNTTLRLNTTIEGRSNFLPDIREHLDKLTRLELVQPYPGPPVGRNPRLIDETIEELVADLNWSAKRDLAVLLRPYERLYPLSGDLGGGFYAGHLKSGAAALFALLPGRRVVFCTFNEAGRVDKALWEDTSDPPWTLDRVRVRFGFELGFIRVREFEANNRLAVRFWPRAARGIFADGTAENDPEIAAHLANPREFVVGWETREVRVSYRTGRGTGATH